jgi:hypothetical protein
LRAGQKQRHAGYKGSQRRQNSKSQDLRPCYDTTPRVPSR